MQNWDQSKVDAHNARVAQSNSTKARILGDEAPACDDEAKLKEECLNECYRRGWLVFHGSMAHKTKRILGEPDLLIYGRRDLSKNPVYENSVESPWWVPAVWMVELKDKDGVISKSQTDVQVHAAALGFKVHIVRSFKEFLAVISEPGNPQTPA